MKILSKKEYTIPINDMMCFSCSKYKVKYHNMYWFRTREKGEVIWYDEKYNRADYLGLEDKFELLQDKFDKRLSRKEKLKKII